MIRKLIQLEDQFATGEPTTRPVILWGANGRPLREQVKTASEDANAYIQAVEPKPGYSIALVLALGAYETYDLNRNADGFNEFPYKPGIKPLCGHAGCYNPEGWVGQDEVLPAHYKSFEQYGRNFVHHKNTDESLAVGDVLKAFWNAHMHRVELIVGLENAKSPEFSKRIADGEYPAVSMGTRIKYDVCTHCGHRAPTRKQYCDHLKFHLREVGPNGLRFGALNPSPRFFDISWVIRPADQTGYMMRKIASYEVRGYGVEMDSAPEGMVKSAAIAGEYLDAVDEKRAALQKISDIDKVVRGVAVDHKTSPLSEAEAKQIHQYHSSIKPGLQSQPSIDDDTLRDLSGSPLNQTLASLYAAGIILSTPEFSKLVLSRLNPGITVPQHALDGLGALQGHILDFLAQHPQLMDQMLRTGIFDWNTDHVKPEIVGKAEKYLEKRSTISDYLTRTLIPPTMRNEEPEWTDTLHLHDPTTGSGYTTTRGAARDAHDEIAKRQIYKALGTAGLLAGGYKIVASGLPAAYRPLAAATAGLAAYQGMKPDFGPHYMTDEGVPVSTLTELHKNSSDLSSTAMPILGSAALVTALGHDYENRLRQGKAHHPDTELWERALDYPGEFYSDHPTLGFLGNLAAYGLAKSHFSKFSAYVGDVYGESASDSVELPPIDVEKLAEKLGRAVMQ